MKKVLSLVLVLAMVLGSFSFVSAAAPNDVVGTEYEAAVDRLIQLGALDGYPDGTFKPANQITRAEFAAALIKTKGLKAAAEASVGLPSGFTDVAATNWAAGYVGLAAKLGIVNGIGNGLFDPNAPVTYEQAVTMVVRALGYEAAAAAKGGYPYGYLIVANETDLLDAVKGTQGAPAPRGLVAQLLDNALEVPMMVQVSYGDRVEHIVSGTRDGVAEKTLLGELGFVKVTNRVVEVNPDKKTIKVGDKSLTVNADFDFEQAYGLRARAWYNASNKVVLFTLLDTPLFDAVEYDNGELYLYGEDDNFDLATDKDGKAAYTLLLNNKTVKASEFNADYAKVVLDSYGDVVWAEGFKFDGNIVVEKVDGNVVESYGYEEISLKGFTIVKDGKTISVDDLEANDIVFYNNASGVKFAVVYNNGTEGKIGRIYTDSFVFEGVTYENVTEAKYLDGKVLGDLNVNTVNSIKTEDKEVTAFVDFYGELVLLVGTRTAAAPSSVVLVIDSEWYDSRGTRMVTLDVLTAEGKVVNYDLTAKEANAILKAKELAETEGAWTNLVADVEDKVVQLSVNTSGKVVGVTTFSTEDIEEVDGVGALSTTASYVNNKARLQDSAVVFRVDEAEDHEDYSVTTWGKADADFTKVTEGTAYYNASNRVVAIYATTTNAKAATTSYTGLIKDLRVLRGGLKTIVTMEVKGELKEFEVSTDIATYDNLVEDTIVKITVVNKTGAISSVATITPVNGEVDSTTPGSKIIKVDGENYYLESDAVIYQDETFAKLRFADLKVDDVVDLYLIADGSKFVNYVVRGVEDGNNNSATGDGTLIEEFTVAPSYTGTLVIKTTDGHESYNLVADTKVLDKDGALLAADIKLPANTKVKITLVKGTQNIGIIQLVDATPAQS